MLAGFRPRRRRRRRHIARHTEIRHSPPQYANSQCHKMSHFQLLARIFMHNPRRRPEPHPLPPLRAFFDAIFLSI